VGWMMNERNLVWGDDLKLRLIKRGASDELGISEEEVEARLQVRGGGAGGAAARPCCRRLAQGPRLLLRAGPSAGQAPALMPRQAPPRARHPDTHTPGGAGPG
jgi:hypothetical protein